MNFRRRWMLGTGAGAVTMVAALVGAGRGGVAEGRADGRSGGGDAAETFEVTLSEAQWRQRLTPAQFRVLREEGTERPYSSALNDEHRSGVYACAGCGRPLFA